MQLVAYGVQDIYLTGNPQITFFKVVYRKHTNFSMECIRQIFKGTLADGARVVATLSRNGDLVHDCFLKATLEEFMPGESRDAVPNPGHNMINNIECEIGGQLIDKHYGHWMEAHAQLTEEGDYMEIGDDTGPLYGAPTSLINNMAFCSPFQCTAMAGGVLYNKFLNSAATKSATIFVPLRFWFCRHVGLALPLIALQYHEVNINITLSGVFGRIASALSLWCNYIYLDTDERRRFAQVSHEYLIEQVQYQSFSQSATQMTFKLNFNHPVKELVWCFMALAWGTHITSAGYFQISGTQGISPTFQLKLNGHDRFEKQEGEYFSRYQLMKYHNNKSKGSTSDTINVYSFALKPDEHQPSGTCNFSRIDNSQLLCTGLSADDTGTFNIYAVNYNVLRIMSGMGGLAYSN